MTKAKEEKPFVPAPGSLTHEYKLGDIVKDKITGIEGTAISRFYHITGCDRFAIELPPKKGKPGEFVHFDSARIELVEARPQFHRNEVPEIEVELGDEVQSMVTGIAGVCCIIHVPLYGAIQCDIQPAWDPKEKKLPEGVFVDVGFLKVTKAYNPKPPEAKPATKKPAERGSTPFGGRGLNLR